MADGPENIKAKGASMFEEIGAEGDETLTAVYPDGC